MVKEIKIVKGWFDLDDDSFSYWKLSERVPRNVFEELYKNRAIYRKGEGDRTVWAVNPLTAIPLLEKLGYIVENKEKVFLELKEEEEKKKVLSKNEEIAFKTFKQCPKCSQQLHPGRWGLHFFTLFCSKCAYEEIYHVENEGQIKLTWSGKFGEDGYYDTIERLENPEEYERRLKEKREKEILTEAWIKIRDWEGEYPEKWVDFPEGEVLTDKLDPPNIYGGGIWYVIQPNYIWVIQNNGADGDCWDVNNVKTGGAGAVGKRCLRTPELEKLVRIRASGEVEKFIDT